MTSEGPPIQSGYSMVIDGPPSCLEFHCIDFFVVGTYSLKSEDHENLARDDNDDQPTEQGKQSRSGSLILFELVRDYYDGPTISPVYTIVTPYAVLDLHFSPNEPDLFAVAASTGAICLFVVKKTDPEPIRHVKTIELADASILVLALAWTPPLVNAPVIAASLSNGRIVTFDYKSPQSSMRTFTSHSLEAWTVAWSTKASRRESVQLYTGGDDSAICRHDLKSNQLSDGESTDTGQADRRQASLDTKIHMAGVTAIVPLSPCDEEKTDFLLTGSYDEYVRVLAIDTSPNSTRFRVLAEKRLHGGVWRLMDIACSTEDPGGDVIFTIVASCMHAGARILIIRRSKGGKWTIEVAARFEEHESMNYASDARFDSDGYSPTCTVVSTSFYDRKLCVWNFRVHENSL